MIGNTEIRPHWSFWAIAIITLIWNAMGAANYVAQLNPDVVATFPESHRAIIEGRPVWATGAFAFAVFGGTIGCILLLLKKSVAKYFFIVSFLGVIITMIHTFNITGSTANSGFMGAIIMILPPLIVAAFLIWYAKIVTDKGWIG